MCFLLTLWGYRLIKLILLKSQLNNQFPAVFVLWNEKIYLICLNNRNIFTVSFSHSLQFHSQSHSPSIQSQNTHFHRNSCKSIDTVAQNHSQKCKWTVSMSYCNYLLIFVACEKKNRAPQSNWCRWNDYGMKVFPKSPNNWRIMKDQC